MGFFSECKNEQNELQFIFFWSRELERELVFKTNVQYADVSHAYKCQLKKF